MLVFLLLLGACLASDALAKSCKCVDSTPIDFSLAPGYVPSDLPDIAAAVRAATKNNHNLKHVCDPATTAGLYNMHFVSDSAPVARSFRGERLLHHARNSSILILGDSLAKQLFVALGTELSPFETNFHIGDAAESAKVLSNSDLNAVYDYHNYHVSVSLCTDPLLKHECNASRVSVVVISTGMGFKPLIKPPGKMSYYEHMVHKAAELRNTIKAYRDALQAANDRVKVVWRLLSHVGQMDEWDFFPKRFKGLNQTSPHLFEDGRFWSDLTLEATWVKVYNQMIREVAEHHCDMILDANLLSRKYIQYWMPQGIQVHSDGVHFCPTGQPRGEAWLLQQVLNRHYHHRGLDGAC